MIAPKVECTKKEGMERKILKWKIFYKIRYEGYIIKTYLDLFI